MSKLVEIYLKLGIDHILDMQAYDHILFLIVLCVAYLWRDWKQVLILATAFTIGHSLTLGLAAADKISINPNWIEFLIPFTIAFTAIFNLLFQKSRDSEIKIKRLKYLGAMIFGLIHGLGFSNFFRSTILPGQEDKFLWQLFAFNLGVEVGQIVIITLFLALASIVINIIGVKRKYWILSLSLMAFVFAAIMMFQRCPVGWN